MPTDYIDPNPATKIGRMRKIIFDLLQEHGAAGTIPTSNRFLFYELVARGILSKEKDGARPPDHIVHSALTDLRERGHVPWDWIVDETRALDDFTGAASVQDWVESVLAHARVDPWDDDRAVGAHRKPLPGRCVARALHPLRRETRCHQRPSRRLFAH